MTLNLSVDRWRAVSAELTAGTLTTRCSGVDCVVEGDPLEPPHVETFGAGCWRLAKHDAVGVPVWAEDGRTVGAVLSVADGVLTARVDALSVPCEAVAYAYRPRRQSVADGVVTVEAARLVAVVALAEHPGCYGWSWRGFVLGLERAGLAERLAAELAGRASERAAAAGLPRLLADVAELLGERR